VTFAQTWDVSYSAGDQAPPSLSPVIAPVPAETADAGTESMPPGLGTACPSSLRQVFLVIGPESAKAAREFTKSTLRDWGLDGLVQEAALIASELVTNAIRHGACCASSEGESGRVELSWQHQASRVICMVTDRSPRPPVLGEADSDAESGRGLQVVAALAAAWGWMMLGARSKAVWAALAVLPRIPD